MNENVQLVDATEAEMNQLKNEYDGRCHSYA